MQATHIGRILPVMLWLALMFAGLGANSNLAYNTSMIANIEVGIIFAGVLIQTPDPRLLNFFRQYRIVAITLSILSLTLAFALFDFRASRTLAIFIIGVYACIFLGRYLICVAKQNPGLVSLLLLWLVSTTASMYFSPFGQQPYMWARYQQTLIHVMTFLSLLSYFRQHSEASPAFVLSAIPISASVVALMTLAIYFSQPGSIGPYDWFTSPPFNSHIRHAGYFFTAALTTLFAAFVLAEKSKSSTLILSLVAVILWSYLLWAGGRTAVASTIITISITWFILLRSQYNTHRVLAYAVATFLVSLLISEWMSVFPWNGFLDGVARTISAENIDRLSNSRLRIWGYSLNAVKDHLLLGLGANGYFLIPERFPLTAQPHNMLIQFLLEWGLIGAGLFLTMLLLTLYKGFDLLIVRATRPASLNIGLLMAWSVVISLSLHGLTDGTYFYAQPGFFLSIMFAIIWSAPRDSRKKISKVALTSTIELPR